MALPLSRIPTTFPTVAPLRKVPAAQAITSDAYLHTRNEMYMSLSQHFTTHGIARTLSKYQERGPHRHWPQYPALARCISAGLAVNAGAPVDTRLPPHATGDNIVEYAQAHVDHATDIYEKVKAARESGTLTEMLGLNGESEAYRSDLSALMERCLEASIRAEALEAEFKASRARIIPQTEDIEPLIEGYLSVAYVHDLTQHDGQPTLHPSKSIGTAFLLPGSTYATMVLYSLVRRGTAFPDKPETEFLS